jgi:hypothetical protein
VDFHGKSRLTHAQRSNNGHDSQALVRLLPRCEPPEELFRWVVDANERKRGRRDVGVGVSATATSKAKVVI